MVEEQLPIFTTHSLLQFLHLNQENCDKVLVSIFAGIKFKSMSKSLCIFLRLVSSSERQFCNDVVGKPRLPSSAGHFKSGLPGLEFHFSLSFFLFFTH